MFWNHFHHKWGATSQCLLLFYATASLVSGVILILAAPTIDKHDVRYGARYGMKKSWTVPQISQTQGKKLERKFFSPTKFLMFWEFSRHWDEKRHNEFRWDKRKKNARQLELKQCVWESVWERRVCVWEREWERERERVFALMCLYVSESEREWEWGYYRSNRMEKLDDRLKKVPSLKNCRRQAS